MMKKAGLDPSYNCLHAKTRLLAEFYDHELEQYEYLPWYLEQLKSRDHHCAIEVADGVFQRLLILCREGVLAFGPCASRGLVINDIFLKTSVGGMLLMICFRNGNIELQIVTVSVISIENESNWSWFMQFLLSSLPTALHLWSQIATQVSINYTAQFESNLLKKMSWQLARATSARGFDAALKRVEFVNKKASQWLIDIGKNQWSLHHSPVARFDVLTFNHVESINGALKGYQSLPVLDCLMSIERYVGSKHARNTNVWADWGTPTKRCAQKVDNHFSSRKSDMSARSNSPGSFNITCRGKAGDVPSEFAVSLSSLHHSCGVPSDTLAPCRHILFVI